MRFCTVTVGTPITATQHPKTLARSLMSEHLKAIRYQQSVRDRSGSSQPAAEQPPSVALVCDVYYNQMRKEMREGGTGVNL